MGNTNDKNQKEFTNKTIIIDTNIDKKYLEIKYEITGTIYDYYDSIIATGKRIIKIPKTLWVLCDEYKDYDFSTDGILKKSAIAINEHLTKEGIKKHMESKGFILVRWIYKFSKTKKGCFKHLTGFEIFSK